MALGAVMRKPKPGLSDLGGLTRVFAYETSQFKVDQDFPYRGSLINNIYWTKTYATGQLIGTVPSLNYNVYAAKLDGKYPFLLVRQNATGLFKWATVGYITFLAGLFVADPSLNVADIQNFGDNQELSLAVLTLGALSFLGTGGAGFGAWVAYGFGAGNVPDAQAVIVDGQLTRLNFKEGIQNASRIVFDIKESGWKSTGNANNTQFSHLHGLAGKVAGYTKEKYESVDSYMGKDLLCVAQRANGDMVLLGSTMRPLKMKISSMSGNAADDYVGSDIEFFQTDAVDFAPPILADHLKSLVVGPLPAYV